MQNPLLNNEYGEHLSDSVIIAIVGRAIERSFNGYPPEFSFAAFQAGFTALHRGLERDGFTVEDGTQRFIENLPVVDPSLYRLAHPA